MGEARISTFLWGEKNGFNGENDGKDDQKHVRGRKRRDDDQNDAGFPGVTQEVMREGAANLEKTLEVVVSRHN